MARKVLLMSTFLLCECSSGRLGLWLSPTLTVKSLVRTVEPLFAVLLATALVMVSLAIHIGARPFEDAGTDWVEMLTLTSQLFLLVAGPVFKTLVSDHLHILCEHLLTPPMSE